MKINRFLYGSFIYIFLFYNNVYSIKPYQDYIKTPGEYECKYDSIVFKTLDSYNLTGWYIYSNIHNSYKSTIIISYGDAGNMSYFLDYAMEFSNNGYDVFLYDYRGFGKSDPFNIDHNMLIYKEFYNDLNAAIDFVAEKKNKDIILFGHSMGATISIGVAGNRDDILAVIAEGPYENTNAVLKRINLYQEKNNDSQRFKNNKQIPVNLEPDNAIENFNNTGFYAFTGSEDEIVTPETLYKLYILCPSKYKSIGVAAYTNHANIILQYTELYFSNIYGFLDSLLRK